MSSRQIKQILEKFVSRNTKDWLDRLEDALWAFRMAFKTPLGISPYRIIYGKPYHLSIEIEHKA